jgi:cytoskeletal protein RodZ
MLLLAFTTSDLIWAIPGLILSAIVIAYLIKGNPSRKEEPTKADTAVPEVLSSYEKEVELPSAKEETPVTEITSPDSGKPFANLPGNIVSGPSVDSTPPAKPKRTYKKRAPKA